MDCKIIINAQYYENYSDTDSPHWKPKGGHEFQIVVNSDVLMYSNELESHLKSMVKKQTTSHEKFEYKGHEVQFSEPTMLGKGELMDLINVEYPYLSSFRNMNRLKVLVNWLKTYKVTYDERDGVLERAIKQSKEDTMYQIGDYMEEILLMGEEQIEEELKSFYGDK